MTVPPRQPDFASAARRHHDDAQHLFDGGRLASADHLAGLAAECYLKVVQVEHLGYAVSTTGPPTPPGKSRSAASGHLPALWQEVANNLNGRAGARFVSLLTVGRPFDAWQINDRYSDGAHCTSSVVQQHLHATGSVAVLVEQARQDGVLP